MLRKRDDNKGDENENQKENGNKKEEKGRRKMALVKRTRREKKSGSNNWGLRSEKEEGLPIGAGLGAGRPHCQLTKVVGSEEEGLF